MAKTLNELFSEYLTSEGISGNQAIIEAAYAQLLGVNSPSEARVNWWLQRFEEIELTAENFAEEFLARAGEATDAQLASWGSSRAERDAVIAAANGAAETAENLSEVADAVQGALIPGGGDNGDNGDDDDDDDVDPGVPGSDFWLTPNADRGADFTGSSNNDTFYAPIGTVNFVNGNTLNTGDVLNGGAGNNTLIADLINDGFFSSGLGAVRPTTDNIQNVVIRAIDTDGNAGGTAGSTVTVNAERMNDLVNVWSRDGDANLVLLDVTTKTSSGGVRNTEALTFRMDHTSNNGQSPNGASNLEVYFDQNYLLAGRVEDASRIQYEVMNQDAWDLINESGRDDVELLDGVVFQRLQFTLNGELINLIPELENNEIESDGLAIRTHQDMADAINVALANLGLSGQVSAEVGPDFLEQTAGGSVDARNAPTVVLVGTPGSILEANENFVFLAPADDSPIQNSNRYDRADEFVIEGTDLRVTSNLELYKAGRGSDGGHAIIGGMSQSASSQGVEVINVSVLGADNKPSNIEYLGSTQNTLNEVNIATHADWVGSDTYASLTIRNDFVETNGVNVALLNANAFLGDLTLGSAASRFDNILEMTATGGGNITYWAEFGTNAQTNASGNGGVYNITTGSGNDVINVVQNGVTASGSTITQSVITSSGGNNTISVNTTNNATYVNESTITTGAGADVIRGFGNSVTVSSGGGNDVIYAENTGTFSVAELDAGVWSASAGTAAVNGSTIPLAQLLHGRDVQVTVAHPNALTSNDANPFVNGWEATARIETNGFLSTERDLYEAAARAINEDPILNKIATAFVDSNGVLVVEYLIDGVSADGDDLVQIEVLGEWSDLNSSQQTGITNALRAEYSNSTIGTGADLTNAYNDAEGETAEVSVDLGGVGYSVEGTDSLVNGGTNSVNAGTGTDVIVLSSDTATVDTVVFSAGGFGTNYIAHFETGAGQDILDFSAWLNNVTSASGSTDSQVRVLGTVVASTAMAENTVSLTDFTTLDTAAGGALNYATMTNAQVLAALNATAAYANTGSVANLVGNVQKSILMVENNANEGEYKVYEVTSELAAGNNNFTAATLVGIVDFSETLAGLVDDNVL